jgi:hypothetical protein
MHPLPLLNLVRLNHLSIRATTQAPLSYRAQYDECAFQYIIFYFMLPEPQYRPSCRAELLVYKTIPLDISLQLHLPKPAVALRHIQMLGARVPKTSIYKYNYPSHGENNVRPTWYFGSQSKAEAN